MMRVLYEKNSDEENFVILGRIFLGLATLNMIDCLLTVIGVTFFGIIEYNPLLWAMTGNQLLWFIFVKVMISFLLLWFYSGRIVWYKTKKVFRMIIHYNGLLLLFLYFTVIMINFFVIFS